MHLRLQPIRVYCMHHVCAQYVEESMNRGDWMDILEFKQKVLSMRKEGVAFISMREAHRLICKDLVRCKKYAVLTFDDGYASLKEILPWLEEQKIPVTLFVNGKYLDGKSYRNNPKEKYLTKEEFCKLTSPLVEIGSHGWEHVNAAKMDVEEFKSIIDLNIEMLKAHPRYIPYHAYTWGKHTADTDEYLITKDIIPVYMDGVANYKKSNFIHRELL